MKLSSLSLVFPAYNEEANVTNLIKQALTFGPKVAADIEVIIVNDGSKDGTAKRVTEYGQRDKRVRLLNNPKNLGYGQTVWNGLQAAKKEWVFFSDSDLQFDLGELSKLTAHTTDFDVIIGYRSPRQDPLIRLINAKSWNFLVRLLFGLKIRDLDCAFKLFRGRVLKDLSIQSGGATFSAELMTRLQKSGHEFKEVPVTHLPRQAGVQTGAKPAVIIRAFKELIGMYRTTDLARSLYGDLWRFGVVGLVSTLFDLAVLNLTHHWGLSVFWATFWGYLVGSANGYFFNNRWTYQRLARPADANGFGKYLVIGAVGLVLTEGLIHYLHVVSSLGLNESKLIAVLVVFFWNFIVNRFWTFRS